MTYYQVILLLWVYFTLWYILAARIKNASIVDIGWGLGFVVLIIAQQLFVNHPMGWLLITMISLWGLRLAYHIGRRNLGKPEDFRYANFRKEWGKTYALRSYFQLFMFQGLLMGIISLAFLLALLQQTAVIIGLVALGVIIFIVGFGIEAIGDYQLKLHVNNPGKKGTLIRTGLWRYTRHPNYFGEAVLWWGIYVVALGFNAPWWVIISPITITYLLRYVSGVPMLEKRMEKYADFADYKAKTQIFVLWFEKKGGKK